MKYCPRCKTEKPLGEFRTRKNAAGERVPVSYCRPCCNKAAMASKKKAEEEPTFEDLDDLQRDYKELMTEISSVKTLLGGIF